MDYDAKSYGEFFKAHREEYEATRKKYKRQRNALLDLYCPYWREVTCEAAQECEEADDEEWGCEMK